MPFKPKTPRPPLDQAGLLEYAVRSLSSRMKSIRDLRRAMSQRAEPGETGAAHMDAVIAKLKDLGYLSDERFAADFTRLRKENQKVRPPPRPTGPHAKRHRAGAHASPPSRPRMTTSTKSRSPNNTSNANA